MTILPLIAVSECISWNLLGCVCLFSACDLPGKEFRDTPRFWGKGHHSFLGIVFEVAGSSCRAYTIRWWSRINVDIQVSQQYGEQSVKGGSRETPKAQKHWDLAHKCFQTSEIASVVRKTQDFLFSESDLGT